MVKAGIICAGELKCWIIKVRNKGICSGAQGHGCRLIWAILVWDIQMFDLRLNGNEIQGNIQIQETSWKFCKNLALTGFFKRKAWDAEYTYTFISSVHNICKVWKSVETPRLQILTKWEKTKGARRQTEANFQNFIHGETRNPLILWSAVYNIKTRSYSELQSLY